mmetsp:Transcript_75387/g.137797  ORF Transcript_75387/g.137797 Transcript_75387/m.137797 type:complete len:90 (+) Transcript_75387:407-676(+)
MHASFSAADPMFSQNLRSNAIAKANLVNGTTADATFATHLLEISFGPAISFVAGNSAGGLQEPSAKEMDFVPSPRTTPDKSSEVAAHAW